MATPLVPGFYGKLPSHGDFVRRRLSGSFVGLWDSWLQNAVAQSKTQLGADWLDIYLGSPIWRFIFTPGVCGPEMSAGVLMPSVDKAGRYFPLTMVVSLPDPVNPLPLAAEYDDWFSRAESILLSALDAEAGFELEGFDQQVQACELEFTTPPKLPAGAEAAVFPGQGKSWHIGIASVDHLGASLRHLHWKQLGAHFKPLSIWWTNGSERVAPSALLCEGIPPADSYAAMLDGQWTTRHWPSVQLESVSRLVPIVRSTQPSGATAASTMAQPAAEAPAAVTEAELTPTPSAPAAMIPEFDPMELLDPAPSGEADTDLAGGPARVTVPESDPTERPQPAPRSDTEEPPVGAPRVAPIANSEFDPLAATEGAGLAEPSLDPLEALGLSPPTAAASAPAEPPQWTPAETADADSPEAPVRAVEPDPSLDPLAALGTPPQSGPYSSPEDEASLAAATLETAATGPPSTASDYADPDITAPKERVTRTSQAVDTVPAFSSYAATHPGNQSELNEDAYLERPEIRLWAVADGTGGHWAGDVASQTVVSELATVSPQGDLSALADDVKRRLRQVHRRLQEDLAQSGDSPAVSGAAVAAFVANESQVACVWAGDTRVYRYRDGRLDQLTQDRSDVEAPRSTSDRTAGNIITRVIGGMDEAMVYARFHEIKLGDWYLLCSRGLYGELQDAEIAQQFSESVPEDVCRKLMASALAREARDNITVVVVKTQSPTGA